MIFTVNEYQVSENTETIQLEIELYFATSRRYFTVL